MYKHRLPFDNFELLKDWDQGLYSDPVVPDDRPGDDPNIRSRILDDKTKFERYVSINFFILIVVFYFIAHLLSLYFYEIDYSIPADISFIHFLCETK